MRRAVLILIIILSVTSSAFGAVLANAGFKVGMSNSGLSFTGNEARPFLGYEIEWMTWQRLMGIQAGVFKEFGISQNFGIQAEIYYARRGMDASTHYLFDDVDYKVRLDYIEVPVALKTELPLSESIAAGLVFGPYLATNIGAERSSRIDGISEEIGLKNVKNFDYGFITGLCLDIATRKPNWVLEIRYNHGLCNVMEPIENSARVSGEDGTVKNRSFVVLIGAHL